MADADVLIRPDTPYAADYVAWIERQAQLLRERRFDDVDWDLLIEEIEDLGAKYHDELTSRLTTLIEHSLKLRLSPARDSRRGRKLTVAREEVQIRGLLRRHPSLKSARLWRPAAERAQRQGAELAALELAARDDLPGPDGQRQIAETRVDLDYLLHESRWPEE